MKRNSAEMRVGERPKDERGGKLDLEGAAIDEEVNTKKVAGMLWVIGSGISKVDERRKKLGGVTGVTNVGSKHFQLTVGKDGFDPQQAFKWAKPASFLDVGNFFCNACFRRMVLGTSVLYQVGLVRR